MFIETAWSKPSAALPPDVRKAFGLPGRSIWIFGLCPTGAEPRIHIEPDRKRRALPHPSWHSQLASNHFLSNHLMAQRQSQNLFLRRFSTIESRHNRSAANHCNPIAHPENFREL